MSVLHADLVGPLPEGNNSKNQRGFRHILSVVDSATRYLWLLPLRHKTAEAVVVALYDDVITRVTVPSAILLDEFMGDVMKHLCSRLGITQLRLYFRVPPADRREM